MLSWSGPLMVKDPTTSWSQYLGFQDLRSFPDDNDHRGYWVVSTLSGMALWPLLAMQLEYHDLF